MISPEMTAGRIQPRVEMNGLSARRTGILKQELELGQALRARGGDIGLREFVEQVGAHDADQRGERSEADDDHREPDMLSEVEELAEAPGRIDIIRREKPADALPEPCAT